MGIKIIIMCIVISLPVSALAGKKESCQKVCRNERSILINQCIGEENYWDEENMTETELQRNCRFMTYDNYLGCVDSCVNPHRDAIKFHDEHVKSFPGVKNMASLEDFPSIHLGSKAIISQESGEMLLEIMSTISVLILTLTYYSIPCLVCATAAKKRGHGFWPFLFFALIFTPMVGFLAVIAFPQKEITFK